MFRTEFYIFFLSFLVSQIKFFFSRDKNVIPFVSHKRTKFIDQDVKIWIGKSMPPVGLTNRFNIIFLFSDNVNGERQFLYLFHYSILQCFIFFQFLTYMSSCKVDYINLEQ